MNCQTKENMLKSYMSDQLSKGAGISRQTLNVTHTDNDEQTDKEKHNVNKILHV